MHSVELKDGRWSLTLDAAPENCHALRSAPQAREEMLNHGNWLILVFAVWSGPDRKAIDAALKFAGKFPGKINLGVRPMDELTETDAWCPRAKNKHVSPLWLFLSDGKVVDELAGAGVENKVLKKLDDFIKRGVFDSNNQAGSPQLSSDAGSVRPGAATS